MNTELSNAVASRIKELHNTVIESVKGATDCVNAAMMASVEIGGHIRQISKGERIAWLRDNCPSITQKQIAAYLSIEATYRKRPNNAIDHRFFALLGMTEQTTRDDRKFMKSAIPQWIAWSGKLTGHFSEMIKQTPPDSWDEMQRIAVAEQLKPIVEIYERITKAEA
jgi:hypothetical protein